MQYKFRMGSKQFCYVGENFSKFSFVHAVVVILVLTALSLCHLLSNGSAAQRFF